MLFIFYQLFMIVKTFTPSGQIAKKTV